MKSLLYYGLGLLSKYPPSGNARCSNQATSAKGNAVPNPTSKRSARGIRSSDSGSSNVAVTAVPPRRKRPSAPMECVQGKCPNATRNMKKQTKTKVILVSVLSCLKPSMSGTPFGGSIEFLFPFGDEVSLYRGSEIVKGRRVRPC